MEFTAGFFLNSALLGVGLAMDAFSVSLANGLAEPKMRWAKMCGIAGVFAVFQALMPMLGWVCVHTVVERFRALDRFVPYVALILLSYIGIKMLLETRRKKDGPEVRGVGFWGLMMQGVATSIDALSVGLTIVDYNWFAALAASLIIAAVTFVICFGGLYIGKRFGMKLSNTASVLGGCILIAIGIEIFLKGLLG